MVIYPVHSQAFADASKDSNRENETHLILRNIGKSLPVDKA